MDHVWEIMARELTFLRYGYDVRIHSFVLMTNHFHLLISTPQSNLSEAMWYFMGQTSRCLTQAGNRINQTYGSRHFRTVIGRYHYFMHAYKYVYMNPVKAGLSRRAEEYKYSSLHALLGQERMLIPIEEDTILFPDIEDALGWINRPATEKNWLAVRRALRHREFQLSHDPDTKKESRLEFDAL